MTQRYLHVKIGPVQAFIRQARRTRDVWAGSFLLSWLSGKAMKAAMEAGGIIERPTVDADVFWKALNKVPGEHFGPQIATLPNKFTIKLPEGVEPRHVADAAERGVAGAWKLLTGSVWNEFLGTLPPGNGTRDIWDRQIGSFWTLVWTVDDDIGGASLAARENWRYPPGKRQPEGGDHCSIMGDWQELSGYVRAKGQHERQEQDRFWDEVRASIGRSIYRSGTANGNLEIGRSERLCAIALVKRLFPLLAPATLENAIGWIPLELEKGNYNERAVRLQLRKYPSTAYMAAVPWLLKSWHSSPGGPDRCRAYLKAVLDRSSQDPDPDTSELAKVSEDMTAALKTAEHQTGFDALGPFGAFGKLDGTLFFAEGIARRRSEMRANAERDGKEQRPEDADRQNKTVETLTAALTLLQKETAPQGGRRQRKMAKASPFYALLRMDGDRIGAVLKTIPGAARDISTALAFFTQGDETGPAASRIVTDHAGLTLYSGGDDVLALLPLHSALSAADALRRRFAEVMDRMLAPKSKEAPVPTLSGGLVFAHYTVPLGVVLDRSKDLLDKQAKDRNGRNSLAVAVLKNSGEMANWVSSWDFSNGITVVAEMERLVARFAEEDERSSAFLHNIHERYADILNPSSAIRLEDDDLRAILLAERLKGKDAARMTEEQRQAAETEVEELMRICRPLRGDRSSQPFAIDGALIAKFLADNGGWYRTEMPLDEVAA